MTNELLSCKLKNMLSGNKAVIVCVGADLLGGDCLGPLVGQMLTECGVHAYVYGTLKSPVNALNVNKIGKFVRVKHPFSKIVAVDSMVGTDVGRIDVNAGGLFPGAAGGKSLNKIGDISITAITTCFLPHSRGFSAVRLSLIYSLARKVTNIIESAVTPSENCETIYNTIDLDGFKCVSF